MALPVKLPWELEEDILSRLPPQSLVRFRTVCKQWNSLLIDKTFINNQVSRSRPLFIFLTRSKVYSIDIINHSSTNPTIELRKLPSSDFRSRDFLLIDPIITTCDELLFYNNRCWEIKTGLWNPWLRQVRWTEYEDKEFCVIGLGYDNSRPEKVYKILGYLFYHYKVLAIYECASHSLWIIDTPEDDTWPLTNTAKRSNVSLNGNLYWLTCSNFETHRNL